MSSASGSGQQVTASEVARREPTSRERVQRMAANEPSPPSMVLPAWQQLPPQPQQQQQKQQKQRSDASTASGSGQQVTAPESLRQRVKRMAVVEPSSQMVQPEKQPPHPHQQQQQKQAGGPIRQGQQQNVQPQQPKKPQQPNANTNRPPAQETDRTRKPPPQQQQAPGQSVRPSTSAAHGGAISKATTSKDLRELPPYPIKAPGTCGKPLGWIETNYLNLDIMKIAEMIYKYDVEIQVERGPRKLYLAAFLQFCAQYLPKQRHGISYDSRRIAVANYFFEEVTGTVQVTNPDTGNQVECTVTVKPAGAPVPLKRALIE